MRYDRAMRRLAALAAVSVLLTSCQGTVPRLNGQPESGISSVLIGCRMTLPTGETGSGRAALNLEGQAGNTESYRLPLEPQRSLLYQVEPGLYRLSPTRSIFGFHHETLTAVVEGHSYSVPFPRDILRKPAVEIKPTKIVALGVLDVSVERLPGREPTMRIYLDDSIDARRALVQREIRSMMDPNAASDQRASAISWTRALEESLRTLVTESQRGPAYRPGQ